MITQSRAPSVRFVAFLGSDASRPLAVAPGTFPIPFVPLDVAPKNPLTSFVPGISPAPPVLVPSSEADLTGSLINVTTSKQYGGSAGGFSATFRWDAEPAISRLVPNDEVRIYLNAGDGSKGVLVMVGLVTRVSRVVGVTMGGTPHRTLRIDGMDFGKILMQHSIGQDLIDLGRNLGDERTNRIKQFLMAWGRLPLAQTPDANVKSFLRTMLHARVPWTARRIVDDLVASGDTWITDGAAMMRDGTLWGVLKAVSNSPWNMLHGDTGPDGNYHLVLEKCPFDDTTGRLTRTALHLVTDDQITEEDLGLDDTERTNFLLLRTTLLADQSRTASMSGLDMIFYLHGPRYDDLSLLRNGCRALQPETDYAPIGLASMGDASKEPNLMLEVMARADAMWQWFKNAHTYRSGTIQIKGAPEIKAGDGILMVRDRYQYMVESVSHRYEWGRPFTTTLQVTRGQPHGI